MLLRKAPFSRLVREIAQDYKVMPLFAVDAVDAVAAVVSSADVCVAV